MNLKRIFTKKDRSKALVKTVVSSSILSDDELKQFEKLFDKISTHLKHPISICQGVNDGYSIGVFDDKTGELKTQAMSYNLKHCISLIEGRL